MYKFSEEQKTSIISLYKSGVSINQLSKQLSLGATPIRRLIVENNIDVRSNESRLTPFKQEIIDLYNSGLSTIKIGKIFNCAAETVFHFLKNNNIDLKDRGFYSKGKTVKFNNDDEIVSIIDEYNKCFDISKVAEKFESSFTTIKNILKKNNVDIRGREQSAKIYTFNEHYFDVIDTERKAYILGLLYADGCNDVKMNRVMLKLIDKHLVEDVAKELSFTGVVRFVKKRKLTQNDSYEIQSVIK